MRGEQQMLHLLAKEKERNSFLEQELNKKDFHLSQGNHTTERMLINAEM